VCGKLKADGAQGRVAKVVYMQRMHGRRSVWRTSQFRRSCITRSSQRTRKVNPEARSGDWERRGGELSSSGGLNRVKAKLVRVIQSERNDPGGADEASETQGSSQGCNPVCREEIKEVIAELSR
jgi:hypothetical protein